MSSFFTTFPEMPNKQFREMKKGIDASYKDFAREWGDVIDAMFDPLLKMLVFFRKNSHRYSVAYIHACFSGAHLLGKS